MKQKHLLSLLQTGMTTIQVVFPEGNREGYDAPPAPVRASVRAPSQPMPGGMRQPAWAAHTEPMRPAQQMYTYKAPLEADVQPGDSVVVDSPRFGLAIVTVMSVDPVPRIDPDADFDYKWIVQKIDRSGYDKRVMDEQDFGDTLQAVEVQRQREQLLETMSEHLPANSQARAMFDAAIAKVTTAPVIAAPAPAAPSAPAAPESDGMQCK